jgi:hypothetical protein
MARTSGIDPQKERKARIHSRNGKDVGNRATKRKEGQDSRVCLASARHSSSNPIAQENQSPSKIDMRVA